MEKEKRLRYNEPLFWADYVAKGGLISPISILVNTIPFVPEKTQMKQLKVIDGHLTQVWLSNIFLFITFAIF